MEDERTDNSQRSESTSQVSRVAAGERGIAIGGDVMQSPIVTGDRSVVITIYQDAQVRIPSPEAIQQHRVELRRRLEAEAQQRWGGMGAYIREEGAHLPIEASPYQPGLTGPREDLVQRLRRADRLLVLGELGSGKTVALQRFAWEVCGEAESIIPVIVPLLFYAGTPLDEWGRAALQETGHLRLDDSRALAAFLHQDDVRCLFLFDGFNEVSPAYRDRLKDELVRWISAYPKHPVIITSRAQDEMWRALRQKAIETIVIQPITDAQIVAYLKAQLADGRGQALFERLDAHLRALAQRPLLLWLMKEAALAGESLPGNRGELFARFVSRMLARDIDERELDTRIPERVKRKVAARLAYELHHRATLACVRDEAVDIVAPAVGSMAMADDVVRVLARHGLLIGDERVRFPHQTLQEYFVAEALREQVQREQQLGSLTRALRNVRGALTGKAEGIAALAADDWWAEAIVQLAGLVDDSSRLARTVSRTAPWLAWWCVEEGKRVDEGTRALVESRSIRLLKSERVSDRRRAVQTLVQIQSERAVDPLFQAAADEDSEVSDLAIRALLQMGEAVRSRALVLAQRPGSPLHRSGLAYVSALAGQPIVYVPPGLFRMGSDPAVDKGAFDNEWPQHEVTLPGYFIGRYPVTVAQWRAFVEASRYRPRDPGSPKGRDAHPAVNVTWHDAMAYCRWLGERSGLQVTLPSEAQWEKAARGIDERIWPWGNDQPDDTRCNFNDNRRGTTPVGAYSPRGDSPYGCADMAGNVWEWTRSLHRRYPYDPKDGREDLEAEGHRVLRGGAFLNEVRSVRCACRLSYDPSYWPGYRGFRVVVSPL